MPRTEWMARTTGDDRFAAWGDEARAVIQLAMENAQRQGSLRIGLRDLALAVSRASSVRILHARIGLDPEAISTAMTTLPITRFGRGPVGSLTRDGREAVAAARPIATALGLLTVRPVHLWLSVLLRAPVQSALSRHGMAADSIRKSIEGRASGDD